MRDANVWYWDALACLGTGVGYTTILTSDIGVKICLF